MITAVERLTLIRAGAKAYRAGKDSTVCPYSLTGDPVAAAKGAAWIRGYVLARRIAGESPQSTPA